MYKHTKGERTKGDKTKENRSMSDMAGRIARISAAIKLHGGVPDPWSAKYSTTGSFDSCNDQVTSPASKFFNNVRCYLTF